MAKDALNKLVRVRLAPSPTGPFHIGTARAALVNWLFARQNGGNFILRVEDTDKERSEKKWEEEISEGLLWLGLGWDEGPEFGTGGPPAPTLRRASKRQAAGKGEYGPYRQSERTAIYKKYLTKLIAEKKAYYCYCTKEELEAERQAMLAQGFPPKYSGHCRNVSNPPPGKKPEVIRFKVPEAKLEFKDLIRGKISFDTSLMGDVVIAKDLNNVLYNFAVVVDDEEMKISHVIRGEDHLPNTPKQILMQKALGFSEPEYAHLPLILNPDRSKMSKRFADTALSEYESGGYLPEAMVNFLVLLGWHPKDNREIFSPKELIKEFDLKRVQKSGAVFNQDKLDWLQKEYIKNFNSREIAKRLAPILKDNKIRAPKDLLEKVIEAEKPRLKTLNEFLDLAGFFFKISDYETGLLIWQEEEPPKIQAILESALDILKNFKNENPARKELESAFFPITEKEGRGPVLWPLRVALSGQRASPDPYEIIEILGISESKVRITNAINKISAMKKT